MVGARSVLHGTQVDTKRSIRWWPPTSQKPASLMAEEETLRPWWSVLAWMHHIMAFSFKLSGIKVGCFLPNVRSALARRPPTLIIPSVWSRSGLFANNSRRFLISSLVMDSIPFGHAYLCISFWSMMDTSCKLVAFQKNHHDPLSLRHPAIDLKLAIAQFLIMEVVFDITP